MSRFWDLVRESQRDHDACVECGTRLVDGECPDVDTHPEPPPFKGHHWYRDPDEYPSRAEAEWEARWDR